MDSQVIRCLHNQRNRRFYVYISNRLAKTRHSNNPVALWTHYQNPVDLATRDLELAAL